MAVTVVGTSVHYGGPDAGFNSPLTQSITVPTGCNKILVFAANMYFTPPNTVSSVAFNGSESFTQADTILSGDAWTRLDCWYRDTPTITTANLVLTWSGGSRGGFAVIFLSGAKTGAPTLTAEQNSTAALAIGSYTGGIVVSGFYFANGDASSVSLTAGTVQTNGICAPGAAANSSRLSTATQSGTGSNVSTTWTPTSGDGGNVQLVVSIEELVTGPTIDTQPSADTVLINGDPTRASAAFTVAATTSGGTLTYDWELETSVGGGVYANLATGSGATWTGQTAASCSATFTAKTLTGRRVRCNVTDDNGTTTSNAVTLTVYTGPTISKTSGTTNGSGVDTLTIQSDYPNTAPGEFTSVTATAGGITKTVAVVFQP